VFRALSVEERLGLSTQEVSRRQARYRTERCCSHHARFLPVLWHQLRWPLLGLLLVAAAASYFVGERSIGSALISSASAGTRPVSR
jgi:Mg2+-importing ATPase